MTDDPPSIHVVAGVITDTRGRILLTRRTEGRDLAGLWEFPGGKREPGETPEAALARELHEELGIDADPGDHVITVPHAGPTKRLRLDVRHIAHWRGTARGREGQALAWVPSQKLASYAMPPADRPVVAALLQPAEYLVTPPPSNDDDAWLAALARALASGIRRVQLRAGGAGASGSNSVATTGPGCVDASPIGVQTCSRDIDSAPAATGAGHSGVAAESSTNAIDPGRWAHLVARAADLCRAAGAEVLVNGDIDLARELGIGLHLPAAQLLATEVRPVAPDVPLAASCHDLGQLHAAEAIGCDFAVIGNIRQTPSHPGRPGLGWPAFARLREHAALPLYAIGGLGPADLPEARQHGAQGIAAIRSLWPG